MTYRVITPTELKTILAKHKKWLNAEVGGEKADLSSADLRSADLRSADLSSADLSSADLSSADLSSADLSSANLSSADLRSANLLIFQFNRNIAYFTFDGTLRIGCEVNSIDAWSKNFKTIGKKHGYSDIEIKAYGTFIKLCKTLKKGE